MKRLDNLSLVIQGAIAPSTRVVLNVLHTVFTDAEVILSTWEGSDTEGLNCDTLILSPDPGSVICDKVSGTWNNVNRQIVSTQAGLAAATRSYILKTRTDILIENADFLSYFGKYDDAPSPYFTNRLLLCNYYTRNPRVFSTCFHPSDWLIFGKAEDVRKYYSSLPLLTDEEGKWFEIHRKESTFFTNYICRFTPEQHIFLHFLSRYQVINCDCYYERTPELVEQTERAFAECFVVLDYQRQLGIRFSKYDPNRYLEKHTLLSHWKWRALYEHYCRKSFSPLWFAYRIQGLVLCCNARVRTGCIRILDMLGVKELIKKFLSK